MKAYVFPGQGSQYSGMGLDLYEASPLAKSLFNEANQILGFEITKTMFEGSDEELKQLFIATVQQKPINGFVAEENRKSSKVSESMSTIGG